MGRKAELTGQVFGRLLVISELDKRDERGSVRWECLCNCGNSVVVISASLRSGHTTSCGCLVIDNATVHGLSRHPLYDTYYNMKARCYNPSHNSYRNYGARGIVVCDSWLGSFDNFVTDMYSTWVRGLQLDRKDTNGNYIMANCRWVTKEQNVRNARGNSNSISRYKGVSWSKVANKWIVSIMKDRKRYHLGYFSDERDAAKTYNAKATELFGEYAYLNDLEQICKGNK